MSDIENKGVSPLEGEGLRGDGKAKWYVVHTYSGHENKVKVNIEKMVCLLYTSPHLQPVRGT